MGRRKIFYMIIVLASIIINSGIHAQSSEGMSNEQKKQAKEAFDAIKTFWDAYSQEFDELNSSERKLRFYEFSKKSEIKSTKAKLRRIGREFRKGIAGLAASLVGNYVSNFLFKIENSDSEIESETSTIPKPKKRKKGALIIIGEFKDGSVMFRIEGIDRTFLYRPK